MTEITVTQQDIDAAKRIVREFRQEGWPAKEEELAGLLSRFRHEARKAALEEAAGIATSYADQCVVIAEGAAAHSVAIAIRSAVGGE